MSDDLISRKELLSRFSYGERAREEDNAWIGAIRRIIKEQPTAFDKEKVIEELKKLEDDSDDIWRAIDSEQELGEALAYETAIKIVEKGGIE